MRAVAQAQPNIALVKYWGKQNLADNLPAVGSLSITLDSLWTRMEVEFSSELRNDRLLIGGHHDDEMLARVSGCLDQVVGTDRDRAIIQSETNFPIAAGLASSASAFAALVMAADAACGKSHELLSLARMAGRASGSAARSFYGGFVELRVDGRRIDTVQLLKDDEWPLHVVVAITAETAKPLGSTEAMIRSAESSPFYSSWVERQDEDLGAAREAVGERDFAKLASVAEHNCLKMHSVMWTSRPSIVYWNRATLSCMQTVRELQNSGVPVFFTIDAGPQVKAVCLPAAADQVAAALQETSGVSRVLQSNLGHGARLVASA